MNPRIERIDRVRAAVAEGLREVDGAEFREFLRDLVTEAETWGSMLKDLEEEDK